MSGNWQWCSQCSAGSSTSLFSNHTWMGWKLKFSSPQPLCSSCISTLSSSSLQQSWQPFLCPIFQPYKQGSTYFFKESTTMLYTCIFCTHVFVYTIIVSAATLIPQSNSFSISSFSRSGITFLFILFLRSSSPHTSLFPDVINQEDNNYSQNM